MARRKFPDELVLPDGQQWFSLSEVAKALNKHKITIYNWERACLIPAPSRIKRTNERRYSRAQVEAIYHWMTETVEPAARQIDGGI